VFEDGGGNGASRSSGGAVVDCRGHSEVCASRIGLRLHRSGRCGLGRDDEGGCEVGRRRFDLGRIRECGAPLHLLGDTCGESPGVLGPNWFTSLRILWHTSALEVHPFAPDVMRVVVPYERSKNALSDKKRALLVKSKRLFKRANRYSMTEEAFKSCDFIDYDEMVAEVQRL